jgi:hypothetical protein
MNVGAGRARADRDSPQLPLGPAVTGRREGVVAGEVADADENRQDSGVPSAAIRRNPVKGTRASGMTTEPSCC